MVDWLRTVSKVHSHDEPRSAMQMALPAASVSAMGKFATESAGAEPQGTLELAAWHAFFGNGPCCFRILLDEESTSQ